MTTYPQQFLYVVDQFGNASEIVNGARTANLLQSWIGSNVEARVGNVLRNAGCDSLLFEPCTVTATPPVTVTSTTWLPADLSATAAPWYDGSAESLEGLGLFVTDWTGLDGEHQSRMIENYATQRGGAWFGPNSAKHRVWKLNVQIFGKTERGCNYIFRWLEQQLFGCCGSEGTTAWFREYCPSQSSLFDGLARAEGVALIEGLTWIDQPMPDSGCFLRAASFTLGIGDPCLYRNEGTTTTVSDILKTAAVALVPALTGDLVSGAPCYAWTSTGVDVSKIISKPRYGSSSAVVTISSVNGTGLVYLPDMRIIGSVDRTGVGNLTPCFNSQISQVVLSGVPAGIIVEVDLARRMIRQRGGRDDYDWTDATGYVKRVTGARTKWASFPPCDVGTVTVEPYTRDQFFGANGTDLTTSWTVSIQETFKFACPC